MDHFGKRYVPAPAFRDEVRRLRIIRDHVADDYLEKLEQERLVVPKLRIRYPDAVARRWWFEAHPTVGKMTGDVEPDGPRFDAANDLEKALQRRRNQHAYGPQQHPLDEIDSRFAEFVHQPSECAFVPWTDLRVEVSNKTHNKLYDSSYVQTLYSSWQVLQVAEMAEMGLHVLINLAEKGRLEAAVLARFEDLDIPANAVTFSISPIHLLRDFASHTSALDAVVWFAEESSAALHEASGNRSGRFQLSDNEASAYSSGRQAAARAACDRYRMNPDQLIGLAKFLGERWQSWSDDGRPLIAEEYKRYLRETVLLAQLGTVMTFETVRTLIGPAGGRNALLLDAAFPDWTEVEKKRVRITLAAMIPEPNAGDFGFGEAEIEAFVDFIDKAGLHSFFWRLRSFEEHALRGNEFALEGMRSDLQGMAVVIEHVVRALGGKEGDDLDKTFEKLWQDNQAVVVALGRADKLARQSRPTSDWPEVKAEIQGLARSGTAGRIVSYLVMAHRIRGSVHYTFAEENLFELERLFVGLMRAAVLTFIHTQHLASPVVT